MIMVLHRLSSFGRTLLVFGVATTLSLFFVRSGYAQTAAIRHVRAVIAKYPDALLGVAVADDRSGKVIYDYHAQRRLVPASNMKLFTAAAALFAFGKNYRFDTRVYVNRGQIKNGTLHGDLYIKFSGDPTLTAQDFQKLLRQVKQAGINKIDGDVVIDGSRFSSPDYAFGWTQNSIDWYFSAPITAVALNQNAVGLALKATPQVGNTVPAEIYRYADYFPVHSTVRAATVREAGHYCSLVMNINRQNRIDLGGCWPINRQDSVLKVAIRNPTLFARRLAAATLKQMRVVVTRNIRDGKTPAGLNVIAERRSPSLSALVKTMLKRSDNFYAGVLIKAIGAKYYAQGNFQTGVAAEEKLLADKAGVDFSDMSIHDGSGQSYYDQVQARQIVRLLYRVDHAAIGSVFRQALPVSATDGTLRYRLGGALRGKVRAKTGTMLAGNVSLSGYLTDAHGRKLVFSILLNHAPDVKQGRQILDAIVRALYA